MRILLVEDDPRIAGFVRRGLKEQDYAVDLAKDGENALFMAETEEYDLIILDLLLPKKNGLDVLKAFRSDGHKTPVLILTAKDELESKVHGLNLGADDYLTKPFGFDELLARVRALLRRRGDMVQSVLRAGDLEMDSLRHRVSRAGREIVLSAKEFSLLDFLMRHAGEVVTRTQLSEHVWERDFDSLSNVIDVHIARLRDKVDKGHDEQLIETVRGKGYRLRSPEKGGKKKKAVAK